MACSGGGARLYEITLRRPGQEPLRLTAAEATGVKVRRRIDEIEVITEAHGAVRLAHASPSPPTRNRHW